MDVVPGVGRDDVPAAGGGCDDLGLQLLPLGIPTLPVWKVSGAAGDRGEGEVAELGERCRVEAGDEAGEL